jgi:hypothetical protein
MNVIHSEEHKSMLSILVIPELIGSSLKLRLLGGSAAQDLPQAQLISSSPYKLSQKCIFHRILQKFSILIWLINYSSGQFEPILSKFSKK